MTQLTPGMQLAEELSQAILNDDNKAVQVASINIVGMVLDNLASISQSLEKLSNTFDLAQHRADHGFFVKKFD